MGGLVVVVDDPTFADGLAESVEQVVGAASQVTHLDAGGRRSKLRFADGSTSGESIEVSVTGGDTAVSLPSDEADPTDVARLLGPVLRGRIPAGEFPDLVDQYRRYQSLAVALREGAVDRQGFRPHAPELIRSLAADAADGAVLERWADSTTVENGTHLVPLPVVDLLATADSRPPDPQRCHAGLAHTYGYLLSPVDTMFGRKRHRWSSQEAAHALGIPGP